MKKVFIVLFCFFLESINTFASYSVPVGKSIFLRDSRLNLSGTTWVSENKNVACVTQNGVALSLSSGVTKINAMKNEQVIASYELKVVDSEGIKNIFTEPNNPLSNSNITLFAITNQNVSKVKFSIIVNNKTNEVVSKNKILDGKNYIYSADFKLPSCSEFYVESSYFKNNSWKKSSIDRRKIITLKNGNYSDVSLNAKRASTDCINFIMSYEGYQSEIKKDPISVREVFDIGYGRIINFGESFYNNITKKEAYADFLEKINRSYYSESVNKFLISNNIMFNQHQFDALVSFTYNLGSFWMRKSSLKNIILSCNNLSNIDKDKFTKEFLLYHHCGKNCFKGLLYRRIDELEIFFFNDYKKDGHLNKNKFSIPECITYKYGKFI